MTNKHVVKINHYTANHCTCKKKMKKILHSFYQKLSLHCVLLFDRVFDIQFFNVRKRNENSYFCNKIIVNCPFISIKRYLEYTNVCYCCLPFKTFEKCTLD